MRLEFASDSSQACTTYMMNTSRFHMQWNLCSLMFSLWWKFFDFQVQNLTLFGLFKNRQWSTMMTCKCDDFSGSKHLKQNKSVSKKLQWNYSCLSPPTIIGICRFLQIWTSESHYLRRHSNVLLFSVDRKRCCF